MALTMKELFETVDRMDAKGFAAAFTRDGRFRFGNAPTVTGREGIEGSVAGFFASLRAIRHEILDVWDNEDSVVAEVEVTYTREDGAEIRLPAATIGRRRDGALADYRIYMDVNPLFSRTR